MCCCAKPNINGEPGYSWDGKTTGVYPVMPPDLKDGDVLLFDEPGRCGGTDSHSFHYRLVKNCGLRLLVRHGGGDERFYLSLHETAGLEALDSNRRYWLLNAIYHAHARGQRSGAEEERAHWTNAAAERRIKVRKNRGTDTVKVFIQPKD
jgi:hypothetical protein